MRIAIIAHGVADQSLLGGPGRVAAEHAKEMARRGHEVVVITTDLVWKGRRTRNPTFGLAESDGVTVLCAPARSIGRWPGSIGPVFSPRARRLVWQAAEWADIMHAHEWPHAVTQAARRACHSYDRPLVVQPHGSIQTRNGARRVLHYAFNFLNQPGPDITFIAGTGREADEIRVEMKWTEDIHTLVNPITLPSLQEHDPRVRARRESWGCPPGARVMLYAHRIVPNKGLDLAIEALAALPDDYHLVVVGEDGGYAAFGDHCHALTHQLDLDARTHFVGPVARTEIDEVILASDVFLLPARRDTFPMMVLHAMACGRPTVVTRTCQSVDALEGGVAVAEPTASSLAATLSSIGPSSAAGLAAAGRSVIERRFSPHAVGFHLEAIYAAAIARQSSTA